MQTTSLKKITQTEFDFLYITTLDSPVYRPIIDGVPHFHLAQLLQDQGYAPNLASLSLRNKNFRHTDFSNIHLEHADLSGAICNHADFSNVSCLNIKADDNTQLYNAKLTDVQLLQVHFEGDPQVECWGKVAGSMSGCSL
jgi:hypothetical protein